GHGGIARIAGLIDVIEFVGFVDRVVSVNGDVVAFAAWAAEKVVADHVGVIGGPAAGHGYGDFAFWTVCSLVEPPARSPLPSPSIKPLKFRRLLRLSRHRRLMRRERKH